MTVGTFEFFLCCVLCFLGGYFVSLVVHWADVGRLMLVEKVVHQGHIDALDDLETCQDKHRALVDAVREVLDVFNRLEYESPTSEIHQMRVEINRLGQSLAALDRTDAPPQKGE